MLIALGLSQTPFVDSAVLESRVVALGVGLVSSSKSAEKSENRAELVYSLAPRQKHLHLL